jgi:phospholipid/cholesterol/gamma-HCH transport system permease protein
LSAGTAALPAERFELEKAGDGLLLKLKGAWRLAEGVATPQSLFEKEELAAKPDRLKIDASALGAWDTALIVFLLDLKKRCDGAGISLDLSGLPDGPRRLIDLALAVPEREGARRSDRIPGFLEVLGQDVLGAWRGVGETLEFLGESFIALGRAVVGRARFRGSDVFLVLQQCGPDALPIVTLISFLVGMILGFVGLLQLEQFGADIFIANLVGVGMTREMGSMMIGIIMSGRTGAAFAAQLGTMNVNDEIAAFRTVGIPPVEFLVLPRMVALIFAVPLLTLYANIIGMLGGAAVTGAVSDITLLQYYTQTTAAVGLMDWAAGLIKGLIYGIIIAIAGCLRGMQCSKSAAAVGDAATSAVVTSIVFIVLAQATLTIIYTVLGI